MKNSEEKALNALLTQSRITLKTFGLKPQIIKTLEELGELVTILCKRLNDSPDATNEAIHDEIADVLITAFQMRTAFGEIETDERVLFKIDRTMTLIRKQEGRIYG